MAKSQAVIKAGVGEIMQYIVHEMNDNTVRFALFYPGQIDPHLMSQAVHAVVSRQDVLHASLEPGPIRAVWRVHEDHEASDCFQFLPAGEDLEALCLKTLVQPIHCSAKAQLHCTLIQAKESAAMVVRISHLVVDGSDARYLLEKITQAYTLLTQTGSLSGFSLKSGSRSAFQVYQGLSCTNRLRASVPALSRIKSVFPFTPPGNEQPMALIHVLPASLMHNVRQQGKDASATVNDLLLTACYRAYGRCPGVDPQQPMSVMSMVNLRRHCPGGDSAGLCNLSGPMPTELPQGIQGNFRDTLAAIHSQTARSKNDPASGLHGMPVLHGTAKVLPLSALTFIARHVYGTISLGVTNLGSLSAPSLALHGLAPNGCFFSGPLKTKPNMQISAVGLDGAVYLCCIGQFNQEDAALVRQLFHTMEEELHAFAA